MGNTITEQVAGHVFESKVNEVLGSDEKEDKPEKKSAAERRKEEEEYEKEKKRREEEAAKRHAASREKANAIREKYGLPKKEDPPKK